MAEIIRFCNVENLHKNAVVLIENALNEYLRLNDNAIMAICGGSSVAGIFTQMANLELEWERVHFFMADERLVPIDNPDSNYKLAMDTLFKRLQENGKLNEANLHPFRTDLAVEEGLAKYNREFIELGGKIALSLLSAGPDGHIASLFPNHPSVSDFSTGYIAVDNSPKPPAGRISASRKMLEEAASSILLVTGQGKADALRNIETETMSIEGCPSKIIYNANNSYILSDIQ